MVATDDPRRMTEAQRQAAIDALLTVSPTPPDPAAKARGGSPVGAGVGTGCGRRYREARLESGDTVTILGQALPWSDVRQPWEASGRRQRRTRHRRRHRRGPGGRRAGGDQPDEAWGNAAIPGFGIGRPTRPPELDPGARRPECPGRRRRGGPGALPGPGRTARAGARPGGDVGHLPGCAAGGHATARLAAFLLGLVGAVMSVCCTLALGAVLSGRL